MSNPITDALVSSIIDDLTAAASLPPDEAVFRCSRAVQSLRNAASKADTLISQEQRTALDAAVRAAQPIIVGQPANPDLRIMVCALHVVIAEWARADRDGVDASANAVEAFILARMLSNSLDSAVLTNLLGRRRADMDPAQWRWLGDLVNDLYPLPALASPEPRTLH